MLSFDERDLASQMRALAASIVVPPAPPMATRTRLPLLPAVAALVVLMVIATTVAQLATRNGDRLHPSSPFPASPTLSPSPSPSPTPSHRATPYTGLPSSTFLATPGVTHTITGTLTELGAQGQQPVAGARIDVFLYSSRRGGHWMSDVTEADGRYELWGIPTDAIAVLYAGKADPGYVQPCVHQLTVTSDTSQDIEIVPISAGGAAAGAAARRGTGPFVTGTVFALGPDGTRLPIPSAMVGLGGDMTPVTAATLTDADGRYVLCGVPHGTNEFGVTAQGYDIAKNPMPRTIDVSGDMAVDVELKR